MADRAGETPPPDTMVVEQQANATGFAHVEEVEEDRAFAVRRFLNPLECDLQRDVWRTLCRPPRPVTCRCGTPIAAIKARYRARVKARKKARMRAILRELEKNLPSC